MLLGVGLVLLYLGTLSPRLFLLFYAPCPSCPVTHDGCLPPPPASPSRLDAVLVPWGFPRLPQVWLSLLRHEGAPEGVPLGEPL